MLLLLWVFIVIFWMVYKRVEYQEQVCRQPMITAEPEEEEEEPSHPGATIVLTKPPISPEQMIGDEMNGRIIVMKIGEKKWISFKGNATTGYAWRIVKIEGNSVKPNEKWHYQPGFPLLVGSGGYFQREFEAVEAGLTDVFFIYEPVAEPIRMNYSYYLRFDVRY